MKHILTIILLFLFVQKGGAVFLTETAVLHGVPEPDKILLSRAYHIVFATITSSRELFIYDTRTAQLIEKHKAFSKFSDMDISPDGRFLFAADYGGEEMGYGTPLSQHYVHRYDLTKGIWTVRKAPKIAWRIEAVSENGVLLLEHDQWVDLTYNRFTTEDSTLRELDRTSADYYGDIEYDPATGRIYHGNSGSSSREINVLRLNGDSLTHEGGTDTYGTAQGGGGSSVLTPSGAIFFYGALEVDAFHITDNLGTFPERILAANNDIACGRSGYYDITTAEKLGTFSSSGTSGYYHTMAFSEDGRFLCVYDAEEGALRILQLGYNNASCNYPYRIYASDRKTGAFQTVTFDLCGRMIRRAAASGPDGAPRKKITIGTSGAAGIYLIKQVSW
jgi:hypothetical protein